MALALNEQFSRNLGAYARELRPSSWENLEGEVELARVLASFYPFFLFPVSFRDVHNKP